MFYWITIESTYLLNQSIAQLNLVNSLVLLMDKDKDEEDKCQGYGEGLKKRGYNLPTLPGTPVGC